jgi:hypothetical protein
MTDTMTYQNIDLSSWDTLYMYVCMSLQILYHIALHFIKQPCQFYLTYSAPVSLAVKFFPLLHEIKALSDGVLFSGVGWWGWGRGVAVV